MNKSISISMKLIFVCTVCLTQPISAYNPVTYTVTCKFSDGSHWWGSTPDFVKATLMVSRCEGDHGGKASFEANFK